MMEDLGASRKRPRTAMTETVTLSEDQVHQYRMLHDPRVKAKEFQDNGLWDAIKCDLSIEDEFDPDRDVNELVCPADRALFALYLAIIQNDVLKTSTGQYAFEDISACKMQVYVSKSQDKFPIYTVVTILPKGTIVQSGVWDAINGLNLTFNNSIGQMMVFCVNDQMRIQQKIRGLVPESENATRLNPVSYTEVKFIHHAITY